MSKLAKTGWALAVFAILILGFAVYISDVMGEITGYVLGVIFGAQWAWVLKGMK